MRKLLIALLVALLLLAGLQQPAQAQVNSLETAPIGYTEALPTLQRTGIPLRLPQELVGPGVSGVYGATLIFASSTGYELIVGNRFPCQGTACAEAYVSAIRRTSQTVPLAQAFAPRLIPGQTPARSGAPPTWVQLPSGIQAFYTPWISYLGPGFAHLTWDESMVRYDIALKSGQQEWLRAMAAHLVNSATQ